MLKLFLLVLDVFDYIAHALELFRVLVGDFLAEFLVKPRMAKIFCLNLAVCALEKSDFQFVFMFSIGATDGRPVRIYIARPPSTMSTWPVI